jgi:hypothetical protein
MMTLDKKTQKVNKSKEQKNAKRWKDGVIKS